MIGASWPLSASTRVMGLEQSIFLTVTSGGKVDSLLSLVKAVMVCFLVEGGRRL